jgi:hypothetical protein
MSDDRGDFIAPPWWSTVSGNSDYTKFRTGTSTTYTSPNDIIGRRDTIKYIPVTSTPVATVSGAGDLLTS